MLLKVSPIVHSQILRPICRNPGTVHRFAVDETSDVLHQFSCAVQRKKLSIHKATFKQGLESTVNFTSRFTGIDIYGRCGALVRMLAVTDRQNEALPVIRRHRLREEVLSGTCLTFHQALSLAEQQHELYLWSHIPKPGKRSTA